MPVPSTLTQPVPFSSSNDVPPPKRPRRAVKAVAAVAGLALLVPVGVQVYDALPDWGAPAEQQIVDRSPAPLLVALEDLAEYHAATGTFQVLVDVERDTPYLPSVISGERTTLFATGNVDAYVDFANLGPERVAVSADRRSVTITLPAPALAPATVDPSASRVVGRERGLAERISGVFQDSPTDDQALYQLAEDKLDAAARESDLRARAQDNTRQMLTALAGSLGYEQVTVTFDGAPLGSAV
jgi:Protein of unknown function (DUF4230)